MSSQSNQIIQSDNNQCVTTRVCIESLAADTRTINSRPLPSPENLTGNNATTTLPSAHTRENIFDNSEMVESFPDVKSDILLDYDINGTRSGATTPSVLHTLPQAVRKTNQSR